MGFTQRGSQVLLLSDPTALSQRAPWQFNPLTGTVLGFLPPGNDIENGTMPRNLERGGGWPSIGA